MERVAEVARGHLQVGVTDTWGRILQRVSKTGRVSPRVRQKECNCGRVNGELAEMWVGQYGFDVVALEGL